MKKIFLFASLVMLGSYFSFTIPVYAEPRAQTEEAVLDAKKMETMEVIAGSLSRSTDSQEHINISILNFENLDMELKAIDTPITAQELAEVINKFIGYIAEDNEIINQTKEEVLQ